MASPARRLAPRRRRPRQRDPEGRMPVMAHLRELRRRIIVMVVIVAIGAAVAYQFYETILRILEGPYCSVPPKYRPVVANGKCTLLYTGPAEGFIARLQICMIAGAVLTAPLWLYQLWAFVTPGLHKNERKYTVIFVLLASVLFAGGMAMAYLILYPGLNVLISQSGSHTTAFLQIKPYITFVTTLMLIFGVAFELPLLIVMLNIVGVLPYRWLRRWQRVGIFLIFVFAGVATPTPDPFTMCAMAVPLLVLFEGAVFFAYLHDKRKAAREAAEQERIASQGGTYSDDSAPNDSTLDDSSASKIDPMPKQLERDNSWTSLP